MSVFFVSISHVSIFLVQFFCVCVKVCLKSTLKTLTVLSVFTGSRESLVLLEQWIHSQPNGGEYYCYHVHYVPKPLQDIQRTLESVSSSDIIHWWGIYPLYAFFTSILLLLIHLFIITFIWQVEEWLTSLSIFLSMGLHYNQGRAIVYTVKAVCGLCLLVRF